MTSLRRPDEIQAEAARAMLAALKNLVSAIDATGELYPNARKAIAQAEAAGIKVQS